MFKFALNKREFQNKSARLDNVRCISEYSITADREVINDRTYARYLVADNVKDDVEFDLKQGIDTFVSKDEILRTEGRLHPMCAWACAQDGDDLKELFSGAEFAGSRGTTKTIAMTILSHNPRNPRPENGWQIIAVRVGGVILLCEQSKSYDYLDKLATYSGFKFEQYMTSDKPDGETDTDSPVDNRPTFKKMIRSDLVFGGDSIGICCAAEIDALQGEKSVELKTRQLSSSLNFFKSLDIVLQSVLADVSRVVIGWKTPGLVVTKVDSQPVSSFKPILLRADEQCLAFLHKILRMTRENLEGRDACEIRYVPEEGAIKFREYAKEDAMDLLTPEFKKKFRLDD